MGNDNLNFVLKRCVRQLNYRATLRVVMPFRTLRVLLATQSVANCIPTLEWCDPRRLDATFGGVMGKYTEQAKLAAVKEYCAGKAGL
ncbi:hypothetical protein ABEH63_24570, partial [Pseudomonas syringae]|uniref:hypothetical protein n=1 Tax=Pseudomonas syringae TaxID=317 RepID=UPI00320A8E67